jgi:hypothetical protein
VAKLKEKKEALAQWNEHFPELKPWKTQHLLRRNGPLLSGICLDRTGDPGIYKPTYFIHNLLIPFPVISLSYRAPLLDEYGYKSVRYGIEGVQVADLVGGFREQVGILGKDISMPNFVSHARKVRAGKFGMDTVFLPHLMSDVITIGSIDGDEYYRQTIGDAVSALERRGGPVNNIIGSIQEWKEGLLALLERRNWVAAVEEEARTHGLPELEDHGFAVERVEEYWKI